jgi:hypothetical protein
MRAHAEGTITNLYARGTSRRALFVLPSVLLLVGVIVIGYALAFRRGGGGVNVGTPAAPEAARTVTLRAGEDLQRALDAARPGDTIVLEAGASFVGPFTLPNKRGAEFITVRSSALDRLPPEGVRVTPAHAALMPKILSPGRGMPALLTAPGAHHYRLLGVEIATAKADALVYDLVKLGADDRTQDTLEKVPHHLVIDRCYIHAQPTQSLKRGVALNSAETSVLNSHVSGFKVVGQDAQAVAGWNGPGPFHIVNNYLEGAGENVLFGGATPTLPNLVPSDIEFRRNHVAKDPAWYQRHASYAGTHWAVKNLFELKNARRVVVDGNLFEYNWLDGQQGYAVILTPRPNDSGAAAVVEDVTFTNNVVRHSAAVFHIAGQDDLSATPKARLLRRVRIVNNLFYGIDGERWGGDGAFLKIGQTADNVTVDHNTILQTGNVTKAFGDPNANFVFTNNLTRHNDYGVIGDSQSPGLLTLSTFFPGYTFRRNVLAGDNAYTNNPARWYPADNFFPARLDDSAFAGGARGDYRLKPSSPFRGRATDGGDVGCDFDALETSGATRAASGDGAAPR